MTITLQALQSDGTWAVRNAFVTENKQVQAGSMRAEDLEAKARKMMAQWQANYPDGRQLRIHNSDKDDPKPTRSRKRIQIACADCGEVVSTDAFDGIEDDDFYCDDCEQNRAEAAWERHCERFHDGGATEFRSLRDQQIEAMKLK